MDCQGWWRQQQGNKTGCGRYYTKYSQEVQYPLGLTTEGSMDRKGNKDPGQRPCLRCSRYGLRVGKVLLVECQTTIVLEMQSQDAGSQNQLDDAQLLLPGVPQGPDYALRNDSGSMVHQTWI